MRWPVWILGAALIASAASAGAVCAQGDGACLQPGLPLAENPSPRLMRAAREQVEAYLACMAPELARLRHEAAMSKAAAARQGAALADVDRIAEQWRAYEERERGRLRR